MLHVNAEFVNVMIGQSAIKAVVKTDSPFSDPSSNLIIYDYQQGPTQYSDVSSHWRYKAIPYKGHATSKMANLTEWLHVHRLFH